jgi:small subunit ribosomal protein S15
MGIRMGEIFKKGLFFNESMARMHRRRKGKSGSNKPSITTKPKWVKTSKKEIEDMVVEMKKKDKSLSEIGIKLRDSHGIPSVKSVTGKKLGVIVKEKGLEPKFPDDLMNLMRKAVGLKKHLDNNTHDIHNKRNLQLIESKIHRLVKYYRRNNKLPDKWTYSYEKAKLLVE